MATQNNQYGDESTQPWSEKPQTQQQAQQAAQPDWGSIEAQLRQRGGDLYDPSDLEGIKRNTSYTDAAGNPTGVSLEDALNSQYGIYDQRRASNGGGGGSSSSFSATTSPFGDWYKGWFEDMRNRQAAAEAERKQKADALYNTWLGRSQQALTVDRNDPIIRQQADAYNANEERARRNYISDVAEASGPLSNLRGEQRMAAERMGQRTGTFEAQLVGRELQAKRDEIAQALSAMTGILSADQQAGLQRELSILDQAIKERGLDIQNRSLDQDWQRALLQNNQFMADLGLRAENQYNYWNDPLRTRA